MNFNLKFKSDEMLVSELKKMVAEERRLLIQILHYLREVESRKLYLSRGFRNLFLFATQELGYSAGAAGRRIRAMRLIKEIPQVEEKIESGKLSLSVAAQVQGFIWREDQKREEADAEPISKSEKLELIEQMEGVSSRECEEKLIAISPEAKVPQEKTKPITQNKTLIQFVADERLMKKIEKLKYLLAHQNYEGRYDKLFEKVVDMALEKLDPEKREMRRAKKRVTRNRIDEGKNELESSDNSDSLFSLQQFQLSEVTSASEWNLRNRHIPQAVRDKVWVRDHGECQYKDPATGRACGSKHGVQLDHIKLYSAGGEHMPQNLRLLCGAHNRHRNFTLGFG